MSQLFLGKDTQKRAATRGLCPASRVVALLLRAHQGAFAACVLLCLADYLSSVYTSCNAYSVGVVVKMRCAVIIPRWRGASVHRQRVPS